MSHVGGCRTKIEQRTSGGPFALRKAFKYFDRDGSGDIDPDEFKDAMLHFGLTFTDRQVLAIFGTYDDDCSGSLDYYEFIDKVIESDYKSATGKTMSVRPKTPPRRTYPGQVTLYRQMLRLKEMFKFNDEDDTHSLGADEIVKFLTEAGHKEPDEDQVAEIMAVLDRDKNGSVSFEELWDWWVGYCIESGCLQGTGLSPPPKEWELYDQDVSAGTGLATDLHDVVDFGRALKFIEHESNTPANKTGLATMSPRKLLTKLDIKGKGPITPRPPAPRTALPTVPKLPSSPGFKTTRPLARPTTQGNFAIGGKTLSGQSFTPRATGTCGTTATPRMAPKLSPLMRNRPLTHRGPATASSGYKV